MEQIYTPPPPKNVFNQPNLKFNGNGGSYFGILIVNMLLCIVTLGFYYPWAKAKKLSYLYSNTELDGSPFTWSGTGKEIFKGFIKAVALFAALFILLTVLSRTAGPVVAAIVYFIGIIAIVPFAIHGSNRYRWSRTSWRGIRFGYRGNRNEFVSLFFKEFFLTLVTLGFYGAWMLMNLRNYIIGNIRFGSGEFKYKGNGWDYFVMNLKGYLLTLVTLGIYGFWWQANIFRYFVDNTELHHEGKMYKLRSTATGGQFAGLIILNMIIFIFTFGIGYAWVQVNVLKFIADHIEIDGDIDLGELKQTEEEYKDAMGDDIAGFLDLDIV